jgi:hypothetical protein
VVALGEDQMAAFERPRSPDEQSLIVELVALHVEVDDDVIEIDDAKWALHGRIAYDGEVIAACFSTERAARAALSRLAEIERRGSSG